MKRELPLARANRLLNTGCVVLVTAGTGDNTNILPVAWQTPVSHAPMLVAVAIAKAHYSHELIADAGEFTINIPGSSMLETVHGCGSMTGRTTDKFKKFGLTKMDAVKTNTSGIEECIGHLECVVEQQVPVGDHTLFIARVEHASIDEEVFDFTREVWKIMGDELLLHHLGGTYYTTSTTLFKL
jgi:flavin reductase (DIM6/NTAB) family NADH-FMN oxidoreductase RutF